LKPVLAAWRASLATKTPKGVTSAPSAEPARPPNPLLPRRKRAWTINGDFTALGLGGVGRYGREVTLALDRLVAEGHPLARDLELTLVVPSAPRHPLDLKAIRLEVLAEFCRPRLPQLWVQLQLPRVVKGGLLSFCNLAPIVVRRQIVCIHDLHTRLVPESYSPGFRLVHRMVLPILGRRCRTVTTVSEFTRRHLADHRVAPLHKTVVTYNGHEHALRWSRARAKDHGAPRPFVICLGRAQAYKNTAMAWRIAGELDTLGIDIHVGGDFDSRPLAQQFGSPPNLKLLGQLSDEDLGAELSAATCLLFPSRIEGFGIPAVEAMALGCPVVTSSAACLPEVCGDAALYADPDRPDEWVSAVARLHADPTLRESLRARGLERVKRYSWARIAEQYLELMARMPEEP
jgi:glycosyltransferase involved in cell wall biosynthesis